MKKYTFTNSFNFRESLWRLLGWGLLILLTGGFALPFFLYFFAREMIEKTEVHEE